MTTDLRLRPATPADAAGLVAFLRQCTAVHLEGERGSLAEVDRRLNHPGSDLALDTAVVSSGDGLVTGFAHVFTEPPQPEVRCFARVHPLRRGRGIGTALVRWALARAGTRSGPRSTGPARLHVTQWARDEAARGLLLPLGFHPVRYHMLMRTDLAAAPPEAQFPHDVLVRPCSAADEPGVLEAHRLAFATHWGATRPELERWKEERTEAGRYEPDLWRLATSRDEVVGFVLARPAMRTDPTTGYIDDLGVIPAWRGRGLGRALLLDAFAALRRRGLPRAALHVDAENDTGAVELYRKAGMTAHPSLIIWERALD